jgi:hypothetical protein
MVLTKPELIGLLQNEVRILLHLITKVDRAQLDYRPTPKQRSTIELLRYLVVMGPELVKAGQAGKLDRAAWSAALAQANAMDLDQVTAAIGAQHDLYAHLLDGVTDEDLRQEITMMTGRTTRGRFYVYFVFGGCAAYRTQLFNYLKACGRDELGTTNLWGGVDPPPPKA